MRLARRLLHALVIVLTLIVGATAAAVIVAETAWFKNLLRAFIVRQANLYLNGQLSIGRLGGNLFFGVELENIGVSVDGSEVVAVKDLGLDYNAFSLISRGLSLNSIRLDRPVIHLRRDGDTWLISRLIKKQEREADRQGPARPIAIGTIGVSDGSVTIDGAVATSGLQVPKRFEHLDAKLAFKYEPVRYTIEITHVSFRGSEPTIGLNALSGSVAVRSDTLYVDKLALRTEETSMSIDGVVQQYLTRPVIQFQVSSDKLSVPELARLVPALTGVTLRPAFEVKVNGPLDRLGIDLNVRSSAGQVTAKALADIVAPGQSLTGDLSVRHLDLAPIVNSPREKSDITADAHVDLHGGAFSDLNSMHGTVKLDAPRVVAAGYVVERLNASARLEGRRVSLEGRASAYGASATAAGRVMLPNGKESLEYDVGGRAQHINLERLPRNLSVPPAPTDLSADYRVVSTGPSSLKGDAKFEASTVAGARIVPGSTVGLSQNGKDLGYEADATVSELDLQALGEAFRVPALSADRYKSTINAHVTAAGHGTTPKDVNVKVSGTVTDSDVLGGHIPNLTFNGGVAQDTAHLTANATFTGFDPAVASGKAAIKGELGGTIDADVTVHDLSAGINPDTVEGSAKAELQSSTIGGLAIDRAVVDGDYRHASGEIRTLEIAGRDVNVRASGTLALNENGQSDLKIHADTPSLAEIGKLADKPIAGIAKVDATVTGNKAQLEISGTLTGNGLTYGANGALIVGTTFSLWVPELQVPDATLSATTNGTFVTLAGQQINELTAKTDYANQQVDFDATAKQSERSLAAAGSLLLQPSRQEVYLQQFSLRTRATTWQIVPGAQPVVEYGPDVVAVRDFRLASANQQIGADGSFGRAGDALKVTLNEVDLAGVDALLLRPPQFSGRVNALSTITGTKDSPQIQADFQINQGGFRQFHYDALTGTVNYRGSGLSVDTKLQQNQSAWITVNGYVPAAVLKTSDATARDVRDGAASPEERFDLHLDSSPIDLGVVQGFTTALTNVKGTVQAKVDVTGPADDPHPAGAINIQNASFTVVPSGVTYRNVDGRVDLQPDRVHIEQIKLADSQQKPMSIAGDLALHELAVGGFDLTVKADDFNVIDNKMGSVRIRSDLHVSGELRNPRLEGELGVTTGRIDLDPIIAAAGESAYSTKSVEYATDPGSPSSQGQTASPGIFDALQVNVHLTVPDDLVVKGDELRAGADAPVGLGALNVTLGGDVYATKEPGDILRLVGNVRTVRGTYDFQGRRFEILRDGTIRFEGLDELNPTLDIRTRRIIQSVEADVNIRGTLRNPEIVLASIPPLEQADILALIVFNQPINQLGEGQQISLMQRAQSMAVGAAAGQLAQSIGNALNLNTFEIQMAPENGSTAEVTIGQQVGQNLYVKLQQGIGDLSTTTFILEYELTNWLRLQTNLLQGASTQQSLFRRAQGSGFDLIFLFTY